MEPKLAVTRKSGAFGTLLSNFSMYVSIFTKLSITVIC